MAEAQRKTGACTGWIAPSDPVLISKLSGHFRELDSSERDTEADQPGG